MKTLPVFVAARQISLWLGIFWCWAALTGCGQHVKILQPKSKSPRSPRQLVVPIHGAYTGAYIDFGDREDNVTLDGIEDFEQQVGKHQAIVAFSSYWGEENFPKVAVNIIARHGSIPLIYWSPWDWPYRELADTETHPPDKYGLENILAGQCDAYIDQWADGAKAFGAPMLVSLCNEANGSWFPWSAIFYGGKLPVYGTNPPLYTGPEFFKHAYRYIVDRVRARGATNVLWVLQLNNYSDPFERWNAMAQFYPGDDYVDWLGLSVYGRMVPDDPKWETFEDMLDAPYQEISQLSPSKPVMVSEWGVGEFPEMGDKGDWLSDGFTQMQSDFPRLHAAVYWHERWQNSKSMLYSNLKVNSSPAALAAYRKGVASPFWMGAPEYK